ncbi:MAG: LPS assembly lipoprotein LptE [Acidobacteriota bacterium]
MRKPIARNEQQYRRPQPAIGEPGGFRKKGGSRSAPTHLLLLVVSILISASCGYHLAGTGNILPEYIKTLGVPIFKNLTPRYELDQKLTTAVINELNSRTRLQIVPSESGVDALLNVSINAFNDYPISFTRESRSRQQAITFSASVELKDLNKNEIIYSNPNFVSPPFQYTIPEATGNFYQEQTKALDEATLDFARRLVSTMLEGF